MLEEAERQVAELETVLQSPADRRKVVYLPGIVEACLRDLKGSLETDHDEARALLTRLIGPITLRRDERCQLAELRGNLPGLLEVGGGWKTLVPEERHPLQSVWPVVRVRVA